MPQLFKYLKNVDLTDYTFIIPSISVGNVPQLTVDLLISSCNLQKSATLWHPAVIPCVGIVPDTASPDVCTACELYINENLQIAVLQIRSSIDPKLALKFFKDLKTSLQELNLKNIVILSSVFDYELHNVKAEKFYYVSNSNLESLETNGIRKIQKDLNGKYYLNGGGFATRLYEILEHNLPCYIIGKYVSEGDNRPDAYSILIKLLPLINIDTRPSDMAYPRSWQYVFGGPPPLGLF